MVTATTTSVSTGNPLIEPAGVQRFRAVSHPESPTTPVEVSLATLDARLTELEAVVHAIAPFSRNAAHVIVVAWLRKVSARIKAFVKEIA